MRVSGAADVHASAEAVWAALSDGGLLTRAVPGLDQIDFAAGGRCRFTLTTAIAAVSGSYAGEARVVERPEPGARVVRVTAAGANGKVAADLTIRLAATPDGGTEVSYVADADVEGAIAGIGQRMLASIAKRLAADAIGGIDAVLTDTVLAGHQAADVLPDAAAAEAAIEQARLGIGLQGERAPADTRPMPGISTGLLAGAAAVAAGIVVGVFLGRRLLRPR
jgi:carbon monoxide dehydrogenase subunit G